MDDCESASKVLKDGQDKEHDVVTPRLEFVQASSCFELGKRLARLYNTRAQGGFKRTSSFYVVKEPITCTLDKWQKLSERARLAAEKCCSSASLFLKGLSEEFDRDAYLGMLDFELYTLELHRQTKAKACMATRDGSQRGSSSSSTSSSPSMQNLSASECSVTKSSSDSSSDEDVSISVDSSGCCIPCQNVDADCDITLHIDTLARPKRDRQSINSKKDGKRPRKHALQEQRNGALPQELNAIQQSKDEELPGHCTGFALIRGEPQGSNSLCGNGPCAILAQTIDLPGSMYGFGDFDCVLNLSLPGKSILLYDCDGRLCPVGCNSSGLGVTTFNFHQTSEEGFEAEAALTVQCIAWELLLGHDSLETAIDWLRSLSLPVMCGSAFLLADKTGAVNVELSPSGTAQVSEVRKRIPIVRANHPAFDAFALTCGSSEKAKRSSRHRQQHLSEEFLRHAEDADICLTASLGLKLLAQAKKVRTNATLACVCMDLINFKLHVQFRERQLADEPDLIEQISQRHFMTRERVEKILLLGAFRGDIGIPRIFTGEPAPHLINWKSYKFASRG